MTSESDYSNPLSRRTPRWGRTGVAIVSIVPIAALIVFLLLGLLIGAWGWAWVFFLLIPVAYITVCGLDGRPRNS